MQKLPPNRQVAERIRPVMPSEPARLPPGGDAIDPQLPEETLLLMESLFHQHGDVFQVSAPGFDRVYVVCHPDDVARVLVRNYKNYPKGMGIDRLELLLGQGLMVTHGDRWKEQRKLLQPAFHKNLLGRYSIFINRCNRRLVERWRASISRGQTTCDIVDTTSALALQFTLFVLFGHDVEHLNERYGHNPFQVVSEHTERDLELVRKFLPLRDVMLDMIERRESTDVPLDVLDILLASTTDHKAVVDHLMTLLVAGHETTASSLASVWYLLSQHADVGARLREELDDVLGGRLPMFRDLPYLPYTRQVIQEALRLFPAAWLFTRRAVARDRLRGHDIPPGTQVLISPYLLHRHPEFWKAPTRFDPDRFAPEPSERRHKYAYIPFSAGPRNCIGDALAMVEMTLHVSTLAQHFELEFAADEGRAELAAKINLRWKDNMIMRIRPREWR